MFSCLTGSYSSSSAFITLLPPYHTQQLQYQHFNPNFMYALLLEKLRKQLSFRESKMGYKSQIFELHWVSVCASAFGKLTQQLMQWNRAKGLILQSYSTAVMLQLFFPISEFHHSRQASPPTYLEFPTWMHQPSVGCDDLTDLECMATIPSRDSSEALVKAEAILANLEQRFKKDQIYVSFL